MFKYLVLFIKPAIFGFIATVLWQYLLYPLHLGEDTQVSSSIATGFFAFSLFIPSLILNEAFKDYRQTTAVIKSLKKIFKETGEIDKALLTRLEELNEMRIPGIMYTVIGAISLISILVTCLVEYHSFIYGQMIIFFTSYVKYILFICAYELDDAFTGRFRVNNMPKEIVEACNLIASRKIDKIAKVLF